MNPVFDKVYAPPRFSEVLPDFADKFIIDLWLRQF
jgi:hypothetical protein